MAKKKDFYNQSISGEDIELLAQFTGKLDKVLHNKRVSYLRKKNQKETKEVSFEANASYLESVSCRIEVSVEECVEEKLMLEETDKHLQNLPVREYAVITCLYINEMSVKETAKELGIKPTRSARIRKMQLHGFAKRWRTSNMGMFKNILVRAHHGDKEAVDKLYEQYKPLLRKYSFVNGVFDEDLHHILVIAFLEMIRTFKV